MHDHLNIFWDCLGLKSHFVITWEDPNGLALAPIFNPWIFNEKNLKIPKFVNASVMYLKLQDHLKWRKRISKFCFKYQCDCLLPGVTFFYLYARRISYFYIICNWRRGRGFNHTCLQKKKLFELLKSQYIGSIMAWNG